MFAKQSSNQKKFSPHVFSQTMQSSEGVVSMPTCLDILETQKIQDLETTK